MESLYRHTGKIKDLHIVRLSQTDIMYVLGELHECGNHNKLFYRLCCYANFEPNQIIDYLNRRKHESNRTFWR
mgnify:CR=1 FL=1